MKNKLFIFGCLLLTTGIFAENGKLTIDLKYIGANDTTLQSTTFVSYYTKQAEALDTVKSRLQGILNSHHINGTDITHIRFSPIKDADGRIESIVTYDEKNGGSNLTYAVTEFYDPKAEALNSLDLQLQGIKNNLTFNGHQLRDLKIGEIKDMDGSFSSMITFDSVGYGRQNYLIQRFYDPKAEALNSIKTELDGIKNSLIINGTHVTNLKIGPVNEIEGGYRVEIAYNEASGSGRLNFNLEKFFDPKAQAFHDMMAEIESIRSTLKINGGAIVGLKVGEIKETSCDFSAVLSFRDPDTNLPGSYTIEKYIDPKAAALNDLLTKLAAIKSNFNINGTPITNLYVSNIPVIDCKYVQAFPFNPAAILW